MSLDYYSNHPLDEINDEIPNTKKLKLINTSKSWKNLLTTTVSLNTDHSNYNDYLDFCLLKLDDGLAAMAFDLAAAWPLPLCTPLAVASQSQCDGSSAGRYGRNSWI